MAILPDPDARLTREAGAEALTKAGYKTSASTLATKVSRGGGPRYQLYSGRAIYTWSDLLAWAKSRVTEPRCSSSEFDAQQRERGSTQSLLAQPGHQSVPAASADSIDATKVTPSRC
jgi:hypothetical protein